MKRLITVQIKADVTPAEDADLLGTVERFMTNAIKEYVPPSNQAEVLSITVEDM